MMCFGGDTDRERCMETSCCPQFGACSGDTDCWNGMGCMETCQGTFTQCAPGCDVAGNAAWADYVACGTSACANEVCTWMPP